MIASAATPRTTTRPTAKTASPIPDDKVSDVERQVFGPRRVYSMTLNMPNLNSAGGSWIIRFSELSEKSSPGALTAPEPTHKVDPGYPIELIRQNVQGTLTLRAVIHSDGHVSDVKVLNSPDDRLDRFAQAAFERWEFRPGTKDGNAVAIEAVISIPFKIRGSF
jgi:TonB family protein